MKPLKKTDCIAQVHLGRIKREIASEIRRRIKENGWTQAEAVEIFGVNRGIIGLIVRGEEAGITFDTLHTVAFYAGLDVTMNVAIPNQR